jgi:prepilin-type N-terminal cleavage/methylation domain-containing protein
MFKNKETLPLVKRAFSLVELSIVILVIGIFAAGIFTASGLIGKSQISTARSLTTSSPVNSITDLSMWLETSMEKSFLDSESREGESVSSWKDINSTSVTKIDALQSGGNKPVFSKEINDIYSVKFNGTTSFMSFNANVLNGTNYTIFIVEKRGSSKSDNYFIGDSNITTANQNLVLGYSLTNQVIHSQGSNSYTSNISSFSSAEARIFVFSHDSNLGKKTYINGVLANESSDTTPLSNITDLALGKNYEGNLGEIIIYTKALKNSDRQAIESYLGKKWNISVDETLSSCVGGTVSGSGCVASCDTSALGVTINSIPQGDTTLTCNTAANFLPGSFSANCSGTTLTPSGSCSCDTANGYALSGSTCVRNCGLATPQYAVFTSGTSYTIPSSGYYCNLKVWAIGGGGGGGGGASSTCSSTFFGGSGGAGGIAYKTWAAAAGESVSFSIGGGGARGNGGAGGSGGLTTATFKSETITANGGTGGGASGGSYPGGTFSGGDGGSNGGTGRPYNSYGSGSGGAGGGAIGGVAGGASPSGSSGGPAGANGSSAADVSGLFTAIANAGGYSLTSGGSGGGSGYSGAGGSKSGANATGFGAGGGGGGGGAGGRGGNGLLGGGGGGGVCWGGNSDSRGGAGGAGAIVVYAY